MKERKKERKKEEMEEGRKERRVSAMGFQALCAVIIAHSFIYLRLTNFDLTTYFIL